jgi:hypothetical protein
MKMKKLLFSGKQILLALATTAAIVLATSALTGCGTPNPNYHATQAPDLTNNPPYMPNQTGTGVVATGTQVAQFLPPPYDGLALGILGLASGVMTLIARQQNKKAIQLATSVAAQGPAVAQAVIDHASNSDQATAVFEAVNKALPPDKVVPPTS